MSSIVGALTVLRAFALSNLATLNSSNLDGILNTANPYLLK